MTLVRLDGCASAPLISYLSGLGVLDAVATQLDPEVTGWWQNGRFCLDLPGGADRVALVEFLSSSYCPPPILSPWNSRGGFRLDRWNSSEKQLAAIETSTDARLAPYREAIGVGRKVWAQAEALGLVVDGEPVKQTKVDLVRLCRNLLPDSALGWIDAAVVLLDDGAKYPELLGGTGGNLGSGDLSSNAHEAALWLTEGPSRAAFVEASLFATNDVKLSGLLVGQLDPGGAKGVDMDPSSLVNPVSLLLALQGASLFASGVSRRLDGRSVASVPFTVYASAATAQSSADGEQLRAELWMPSWSRPMTVGEVRVLLSEGRAQWSGRQSASSLDLARAAATLGVDRSVTSFTRFLVATRHGQANLAIPIGEFDVHLREGVQLTAAIDPFLLAADGGGDATQSIRGAVNGLRRAMFSLAERSTAASAREVLSSLYHLECAVGVSTKTRERVASPVWGLRAVDWLSLLDDGSVEFGLARALASQRDERWEAGRGAQAMEVSTFPVMCRSVTRIGTRKTRGAVVDDLSWSGDRPLIPLLGPAVMDSLVGGMRWRGIRCAQHPPVLVPDATTVVTPGISLAFDRALTATLEQVVSFAVGAMDSRRFIDWLQALVMLDWSSHHSDDAGHPGSSQTLTPALSSGLDGYLAWPPAMAGPAFTANAPFFSPLPIVTTSDGAVRRVRFRPSSAHLAAIARGDAMAATTLALRRLRQFGLDAPRGLQALSPHPWALVAALVPLSVADLRQVVAAISPALPQVRS